VQLVQEQREEESDNDLQQQAGRGVMRGTSTASAVSDTSSGGVSRSNSTSSSRRLELQQYAASSFKRGIDLTKYTYNQRNAEYKLYQVEQKFNKVSYIMSHLLWMLFPLSAVFYALFLFDMMGDARGFKDAIRISLLMFGLPCALMIIYEVCRHYLVVWEIDKIERELKAGRDSQRDTGVPYDFTSAYTDSNLRSSIAAASVDVQREIAEIRAQFVSPQPPEGTNREAFQDRVPDRVSFGALDGAPFVPPPIETNQVDDGGGRSSRSNSRSNSNRASPRGTVNTNNGISDDNPPSHDHIQVDLLTLSNKPQRRRAQTAEDEETKESTTTPIATSTRTRSTTTTNTPQSRVTQHKQASIISSFFTPGTVPPVSPPPPSDGPAKYQDFPNMVRYEGSPSRLTGKHIPPYGLLPRPLLALDEEEEQREEEKIALRVNRRVDKVEVTTEDKIQQALYLLLK
jgi:hypothetical protein